MSTLLNNDNEVKMQYDAKWLKIFYHNSSSSLYFDANSALYSISDSHRYSILKYIEYINTFEDDKFEFLLEYPEIENKYNRWKQTSNPIYSSVVEGFETNDGDISFSYFGGLVRRGSNTFLHGTVIEKGWWNYAIGAYKCDSNNTGTFPGPCGYTFSIVNQVYLWIRVKSFTLRF